MTTMNDADPIDTITETVIAYGRRTGRRAPATLISCLARSLRMDFDDVAEVVLGVEDGAA